MPEKFSFDNQEAFLSKLRELSSKVPVNRIRTFTPYSVHEISEILGKKPSRLKFFTLAGGIIGLLTGFALTIYTATSWPLMVGGKPIVSIPAFVIIAFELLILFGGLFSFLGFLLLARLPDINHIVPDEEFGNQFVIIIEDSDL